MFRTINEPVLISFDKQDKMFETINFELETFGTWRKK
jgi:hypothetical protein